MLVGAGMEPPSFDPNRMLLNEVEIYGSFVYDADGFDRAIELLDSGAMPVDALVDPTDVPLDLLGRRAQRTRRREHPGQGDGRAAGFVNHLRTTDHRSRQVSHPFYPSGNPRFNHVAMSLPADLLDEYNRNDLCRLLHRGARLRRDADDDHRPQATHPELRPLGPVHLLDRRRRPDEVPPDGPLRIRGVEPRGPRGVRDRAVEFKKADDRVELIDLHMDDQGVVKIHSIYLKYLLPDDVRAAVVGVRGMSP